MTEPLVRRDSALPRGADGRVAQGERELLRVDGLCKYFPVVQGVFGKTVAHVKAVDDLSLVIARGETLGMVGESGCGKTTAGRSILRLIEPTKGRIHFDGVDLSDLSQAELRQYRRHMQIVFQDPFGSLNPRMRVLDLVGEAIERHGIASGAAVEARVRSLLARVGVPASWANRYPHEFSGGQRQRVGIARAIALEPKLIVCDEAVSALDVSIRAQVINLLIELRQEYGLAYLFIAHDLSVVRHISDRVAVMYLGRLVEIAESQALFDRPAHPYTRALLSAVPVPDPRRKARRLILQGDVPTPLNPPRGCHFHTRCPVVMQRCREETPELFVLEGGRQSRCFHAEGLGSASDWYERLEARFDEAARDNVVRASERIPATAVVPPPAPSLLPEQASSAVEDIEVVAPGGVVAALATDIAEAAGADRAGAGAAQPPARPRLLIPVSIQASGAALIAFGHWGWGALVVAFGFWRVRKALGSAVKERRDLSVGFVLLLMSAMLLSLRVVPLRASAATRRHMFELAEQLDGYANNAGALPSTLADVRWRTLEAFGTNAPLDGWDRPLQYKLEDSGHSFSLTSLGVDGRPSDDDIVVRFARAGTLKQEASRGK
ncbi:MAG: ABC transporter ATP-binding protein [Polyangiaceae bacterium]